MKIVLAVCWIVSALSLADCFFSNEVNDCFRTDHAGYAFCHWAKREFPTASYDRSVVHLAVRSPPARSPARW